MSFSVEPRALDLKRQKTVTSENQHDGASCFELKNHDSIDESEDEIKDSQEEVSGFLRGGLQDSSNCIEPAVVDGLPRDSIRVEAGTRSPSVSMDHSKASISESLGKKARSIPPLAHQLRELSGENVYSDGDPCQRFRNSYSKIESRGIPLSYRLQELVRQAQHVSPSTCLPHPQLRVNVLEPTEQTDDNDDCIHTRFKNTELSLESRGIPLALQLQELVQQSPAADPSTVLPHQQRGNKLDERQHPRTMTSTSSVVRNQSAIEDDKLERVDCKLHFQDKSLKEDASAASVNSTSFIWERYEDSVRLDSPVETNADRPNSKEALSGFSKLLQKALKELTDEQTQFQKFLTSSQSSCGCLEVLILGKYLEGQLTACHCEILQSPPEWNDAPHAPVTPVENMDNLTIVDVLFSSHMSGDLQLEVGRVVRVHPPWQEVHEAGQLTKIILGTFFCEMVE